jgi:hypothetical protein
MGLIAIDWKPGRSKLREFAVIWLVAFSLIAALLAWKTGCFSGAGSWRIPYFLWALAVLVGITGIILPGAVRPVYMAWMGIAFPIGWLLSHFLLAIIYYGLFTLIAAVFRLSGRDLLKLKLDQAAATYWEKHDPAASTKRYLQKF